MKALIRLTGALAALVLVQLSACTVLPPHLAQAPRPARQQYRHAQRHHAQVRPHLKPVFLPWN